MKMVGQTDNASEAPRSEEMLHVKEYVDYIRELGFQGDGRLKLLLQENTLPSAQEPTLRATVLVGHAKIAVYEGHFVDAKMKFDKALKYTSLKYYPNISVKDKNNVVAYIHYEHALFCELIHARELAISHFKQARTFAQSPKMKLLLDFQDILEELFELRDINIAKYNHFIEKFQKNEMKVMEGIALMRIANYMRDKREYKRAQDYYDKAMILAKKNEFNYLEWNINNSLGLLLSKQGEQEKAIIHYEKCLATMTSPYFKALMLKNKGTRYYYLTQPQPEKTIDIYKEALEHCQIYGISSQISILAEAIGDLYLEISNSTSHAYQYYKIGFDEVMLLANQGIPITEQRLRIIGKYNKIIQDNVPDNFMALKEANLFQWAIGKTWIEIKDLFHYNLFTYHFLYTGIGQKTFSHLKINSGTFYSLSKRMRELRGIEFPDLKGIDVELPPHLFLEPIQQYVQLHREKTWKQVNKQFERDIFEFLFEESGYNKFRLSKTLDRSYAMVLKQTKHLTDAHQQQTAMVR